MKTKLLMIFIALIIFGAGSCKKGDQGDVGPEGAQGEKGVTGAKGADGSMIYSGTAAPATSLGKNGDFYFRTSTGDLYGPKVAAGWGNPTKLKGATGSNGTNGKNGSQFLSGTTIPASTLGVTGDFYFNKTQMILYGPKTASGWGVGTNLKADAKVMYSGYNKAVRVLDSVIDGSMMKVGHIYASQITEAVMKTGVVLVYMDYGGGPYPLPFTSIPINFVSTIGFKLKLKELIIFRFSHNSPTLLDIGSILNFRYVIIPGNYYLGMKKRNVDFRDPVAVDRAIREIEN